LKCFSLVARSASQHNPAVGVRDRIDLPPRNACRGSRSPSLISLSGPRWRRRHSCHVRGGCICTFSKIRCTFLARVFGHPCSFRYGHEERTGSAPRSRRHGRQCPFLGWLWIPESMISGSFKPDQDFSEAGRVEGVGNCLLGRNVGKIKGLRKAPGGPSLPPCSRGQASLWCSFLFICRLWARNDLCCRESSHPYRPRAGVTKRHPMAVLFRNHSAGSFLRFTRRFLRQELERLTRPIAMPHGRSGSPAPHLRPRTTEHELH
jgi:hypothetical protein